MPVSGTNPEPGQFTPPLVLAMLIAPRSLDSGPVGGTYGICSHRNNFRFSSAFARSAGVKSIRSLSATCVREYAGGLLGKGCVFAVFSCAIVDCGTGFSSIGQIGTPVMRSNTYSHPCFEGTATTLRGLPSIVTSINSGADDMSWSHSG